MQFFFDEEKKLSGALADKIELVCEGMNYLSETDAPVELFVGKPALIVSVATILHQTGSAQNAPVDEIDTKTFFARLTAEHDQRHDTQAKKFLELQKLLEENLRDLKVYKIGRIRLAIYVVGIDRDGTLIGVKTEAVET
jgi:hypothetical protein